MSTIKSSSEHLTLNADGASKDIKFQANGVEKASISSAGAFTSTTIDATALTGALPAISGASLTNVPAANITGTLPAIDGSNLTGMSGGLYASVAIICDEKAYNVSGGTFTSGAWRTRDLNTEVSDADGIVSISSNQFTLAAGTYTIDWSAPVYAVNFHATRLYNVTGTTSIQTGMAIHSTNPNDVYGVSSGSATVTIGSSSAFEIQHQCSTTQAGNGFGVDPGMSGVASIYTIVKILKHS